MWLNPIIQEHDMGAPDGLAVESESREMLGEIAKVR
jgi:hypothetical protein